MMIDSVNSIHPKNASVNINRSPSTLVVSLVIETVPLLLESCVMFVLLLSRSIHFDGKRHVTLGKWHQ